MRGGRGGPENARIPLNIAPAGRGARIPLNIAPGGGQKCSYTPKYRPRRGAKVLVYP